MVPLNSQQFNFELVSETNLFKNYSCKALKKILYNNFKIMKKKYRISCQKNSKTPSEEWFTDNFYILEEETKSLLKSLKIKNGFLSLKNDKLPIIYHIIYYFFISPELKDITCKNITKIINLTYSKIYLSVEELSFLPSIIKISLINNIYFAITQATSEEKATELIAFSIKNLKNIDSIDFNKIIEEVSPIEKIFLQDPTNTYLQMDDDSKCYYRYLLSVIAKKKKTNEKTLALDILTKSKQKHKHIGYYLIYNNEFLLTRKKLGKIYIYINIFIPLIFSLIIFLLTKNIFIFLISYLPFWEIVRPLNEYFIFKKSQPDILPKIDIKNSIPKNAKTLIVISSILPKADQAKHLKTKLENLYFSNGSGEVNFCILADFTQNKYPESAHDKPQIDASIRIIDFLNKKYGNKFFLLVRKRTYNKTQHSYIGWERKRGAITELIRFIKGEKSSIFICKGEKENLKGTKYIITLDSDTKLLIDSAQKFVATALHPINKPIIDYDKKIVTNGHAILTPKISIDLNSAKKTLFSQIMAGCGGTTTYDINSTDLYQNLFGETIYSGKGLIDVDAFFAVLNNKFPENSVLSHDILEGIYLKAGFVSDVEITDSYPSNISSWLSRLHRWVRGDWQNINYIFKNDVSKINKYKLFDNLRRSITPIFSLITILTGIYFVYNNLKYGYLICLIGFFSITFNSFFSALISILFSGWFTLSRKFYTQIIPQSFEYIFQAIFLTIMLISQTLVSLDAILKSLYRKFISKKNLLEWTTAAQAETQKINFLYIVKKFFWAEIIGIIILLLSPTGGLKILGLLFSLIIPLAIISNSKQSNLTNELPHQYKEPLIGYAADMWKFYENHFKLSYNYLPPDNIQLSPIRAIAYRTSPTNIGFLLISTLAARDFDFIDTNTLYMNINLTLTTIENLEKWNGNLYNWYDIKTLNPIDTFISTVDSGNFVSCLVAVKEGLKDYYFEKKELLDLVVRLQKIIDETNLSEFYCKKRNLFSIGYDAKSEKFIDSYYDFLMSEARLTSYFAISKRQVPKKHWGSLNRTLSRNGFYAGPISWTGTMFEFFMPHLLLPSYSGSLLDEALRYCIYCQQKRIPAYSKIPWGISESGFYAFDNNLYYQYKAHGVQKLGVKQNLEKDLVISPYSTFLTVAFAPKMAMKNLFKMEKMGFKGVYGFFEAIDFTKSRVDDMEIIKSYMAHHIGMSIIAVANAVFYNRMQKRFMRDKNMKATKELLEEKISRDAVVFDNVVKPIPDKNIKTSKSTQEYNIISPENPKVIIFKNSDITNVLTDNGSSFLISNNKCLTKKPIDIIRKPQGIFLFIHSGNITFSATAAPFYNKDVVYQTKFNSNSVSYLSKIQFFQTSMVCYLDKTLACEQRQIIIKNNSNFKKNIEALIFLEPILSNFNDYISHPSFTKLFITAAYDKDFNILMFTKRLKENETPIYLGISFLENIKFEYETKKENLLNSGYIKNSILSFWQKNFTPSDGLPDAIAAIKLKFELSSFSQKDFTLIITSSDSYSGIVNNIIESRNKGHLDSKSSVKSKIFGDAIEDKISLQLLPYLMLNQKYNPSSTILMEENKQQIDALWSLSISGDLPIVLLEICGISDSQRIEIYVKTLKKLRLCGVLFDLVLTYRELKGETILKNFIESIINKLDATLLIKIKGGIFLLNLTDIEPEKLITLKALSQYVVPNNLSIENTSVNKYLPININSPQQKKFECSTGYTIYGGTFFNDRFYVNKSSPLPYNHILSNQTFGTLLSSNNLGYSWAINSREIKLTPWFNDIATDNDGELLILKYKGKYYNLISGALASFSPKNAIYEGVIDDFEYTVTVFVPHKGNNKFCEIIFKNNSSCELDIEIAYYIEPILGVNYLDANKLYCKTTENQIIIKHCLSKDNIFLSVDGKDIKNINYVTNPIKFFTGEWKNNLDSNIKPVCAALIANISISKNSSNKLKYGLEFSKSDTSLNLNKLPVYTSPTYSNKIIIKTPEDSLNYMINTWVPHQIICGRIWSRTGFYQCGGAYGFRDQLQDSLCYLILNPKITKQQIIRASAVQFKEGDVLHWWHNIPQNNENIKGVRTKYSDDLLWLPYVVSEYLNKTADYNILDITTHYIEGDILKEKEYEKYFSPKKSNIKESIYEHCLKAINYSLKFGDHNIPLIGCGDWSDGYNRIGIEGKGESVWLGMFLSIILQNFSKICEYKKDIETSKKYNDLSKTLKENIEQNCWDGEWYIRAFYDDGSKMGSHNSIECKIDSLPQSFSVFADMLNKKHVETSLNSAIKYLVDDENKTINLFTPPFVNSNPSPGYVKAYPAGIRENGGQYTHAGVWLAIALLKFGKIDIGYKLINMLNPAYRCKDKNLAKKYKTEPYYLPGDIYTHSSIIGHGGWSIYTGSAGWYYKCVIEELLGINLKNGKLEINPKIPSSWNSFEANIEINQTTINLSVSRSSTIKKTHLPYIISFDGKVHNIEIIL